MKTEDSRRLEEVTEKLERLEKAIDNFDIGLVVHEAWRVYWHHVGKDVTKKYPSLDEFEQLEKAITDFETRREKNDDT